MLRSVFRADHIIAPNSLIEFQFNLKKFDKDYLYK